MKTEKKKRLSLTGQLFGILIISFILIMLVVVPYLSSKTRAIVDEQLFATITGQQTIIMNLFQDYDEDISPIAVTHLRYDIDYQTYQIFSSDPRADFVSPVVFNRALKELISRQKDHGQFADVSVNGKQLYYVITADQEENIFWISYAFNDVSYQLLEQIQNELVNVFYIVILLIFLIMIVWTLSMIAPLRTITQSIKNIKIGEPFSLRLKLHKSDEIGQVASALVDMKNELDHQDQLQSDLIHNISHDLKTPIATIRSYSEGMKAGVYPYGDASSSLDVIIANADRLDRRVKDFLYLNRLDYLTASAKEGTETCDISKLAGSIISELEGIHEDIDFVTEIEPDIIFQGSAEHWRSCLDNLLDNALRYAKTTIIVVISEDYLMVYNDGEALADDDIFAPYKKGPKGNFGLGLAIVKKICDMYHYEVAAQNRDEGVAFIIKKDGH